MTVCFFCFEYAGRCIFSIFYSYSYYVLFFLRNQFRFSFFFFKCKGNFFCFSLVVVDLLNLIILAFYDFIETICYSGRWKNC